MHDAARRSPSRLGAHWPRLDVENDLTHDCNKHDPRNELQVTRVLEVLVRRPESGRVPRRIIDHSFAQKLVAADRRMVHRVNEKDRKGEHVCTQFAHETR